MCQQSSSFDIIVDIAVDKLACFQKSDIETIEKVINEIVDGEELQDHLDCMTVDEYLTLSVLMLNYINIKPSETSDYYNLLLKIASLISESFEVENKNGKNFITWDYKMYKVENNGKVKQIY